MLRVGLIRSDAMSDAPQTTPRRTEPRGGGGRGRPPGLFRAGGENRPHSKLAAFLYNLYSIRLR